MSIITDVYEKTNEIEETPKIDEEMIGRPGNRLILSENISLRTDKAIKNNLNTIAIGSPSSGKGRFILSPNLLDIPEKTSFVIADPAGELTKASKSFLEKKGFKTFHINLKNIDDSDCVDIIKHFCKCENDCEEISEILINSLFKDSITDAFWLESIRRILSFSLYYTMKTKSVFSNLEECINKIIENRDEIIKFCDENTGSKTCKMFLGVLECGEKTLNSLCTTILLKIKIFKNVAKITDTDTININEIYNTPVALFLESSITENKYTFLANIFICMVSAYNCKKHESESLEEMHTMRFVLDEFPNLGRIPKIEIYMAVGRKYKMSYLIAIQDISQVKELYGDAGNYVVSNCDNVVFLGSSSYETLKWIERLCGKKQSAIDTKASVNIIDTDSLVRLSDNECLVCIKRQGSFLDKKYNAK